MIIRHTNSIFNENTWIYTNPTTNQGIIVDPGENLEVLFEQISTIDITHIFVTHGHPDHIQGLQYTKDRYPNALIVAHENALKTFSNADYNLSHYMNMEIIAPNPDWTFSGTKSSIHAIGHTWDLILTQGHAIDHICIFNAEENFVFVGDVIFDQESMKTASISSGDPSFPEFSKFTIGRTDFPYGCDLATMLDSISTLMELPEDTLVHSGHGADFLISDAKNHILPIINELKNRGSHD